jgi:ketosteroid isomerase-like protein
VNTEQILELERQRSAAYDAVDEEAFGRLLADDYIHIHGVGGLVDRSREEYLATMATKTPGRSVATRGDDVVVRDYGDFVLVIGSLHIKMWPADGSAIKEIYANALSVWRQVADEWRLACFQVTPIVPR